MQWNFNKDAKISFEHDKDPMMIYISSFFSEDFTVIMFIERKQRLILYMSFMNNYNDFIGDKLCQRILSYKILKPNPF